jgi:SAM-dependent methyltransferase
VTKSGLATLHPFNTGGSTGYHDRLNIVLRSCRVPVLNSPEWSQTPLGAYLVAWEQARLDALVTDIFGYNALQLGLVAEDLLRANRMPFRLRCARAGKVAVIAAEENLPFASASLDLVVLAHVLEFAGQPHQVLREVERVLVAEGHVIICGFNPYSLWGLTRRLNQSAWPRGQYLPALRVRDWLALLGFDVQSTQSGVYVPAVNTPDWLARWRWLDWLGRRWWLGAGAVYLIHGIKRVPGARLILPNWRDARASAKALSAVARRDEHQ